MVVKTLGDRDSTGRAWRSGPLLPFRLEPGGRSLTASTRDDVEELAKPDVDDLGGELLTVPRPNPGEEHLIETECLDGPEAARMLDQGRRRRR